MQRLFQSSSVVRFVQQSSLLTASHSFSSLPSRRVHGRFLSTQFPSIDIPDHPISEKLRERTQAAVSQTPEEIWKQKSKKALEDAISSPPADPYAGRSITNKSATSLAATFKHLDQILQRNKVRQQLRLTERHEKKGYKRRRLSSERWRKQFANEVRKKVQLVIKIKNRGA